MQNDLKFDTAPHLRLSNVGVSSSSETEASLNITSSELSEALVAKMDEKSIMLNFLDEIDTTDDEEKKSFVRFQQKKEIENTLLMKDNVSTHTVSEKYPSPSLSSSAPQYNTVAFQKHSSSTSPLVPPDQRFTASPKIKQEQPPKKSETSMDDDILHAASLLFSSFSQSSDSEPTPQPVSTQPKTAFRPTLYSSYSAVSDTDSDSDDETPLISSSLGLVRKGTSKISTKNNYYTKNGRIVSFKRAFKEDGGNDEADGDLSSSDTSSSDEEEEIIPVKKPSKKKLKKPVSDDGDEDWDIDEANFSPNEEATPYNKKKYAKKLSEISASQLRYASSPNKKTKLTSPFKRKRGPVSQLPLVASPDGGTMTVNRICNFCHATETPMWRHGPLEYPDLCNKCGVKWMRGRLC